MSAAGSDDVELTKTDEWFRDRLGKLLGWGGTAFVVLGGWLISNDNILSIDHRVDADHREAALFLCFSVPLLWAGWYVALLKTHAKCPSHPTILVRSALHAYIVVTGVALAILLVLAIDGAALLSSVGA